MIEKEIWIYRSDRKTLSIQIKRDGIIVVRAPLRLPRKEIDHFLEEKSQWVEEHLRRIQETNQEALAQPLSPSEVRALAELAAKVLPPKIDLYAKKMGVTLGKVTIRNQATRWGSCSSNGNLNLNCLLMLTPDEVQDYVIIHELAHRKEMNHSAAFWKIVEKNMPTYNHQRQWLKDNGGLLLARVEAGKYESSDIY